MKPSKLTWVFYHILNIIHIDYNPNGGAQAQPSDATGYYNNGGNQDYTGYNQEQQNTY